MVALVALLLLAGPGAARMLRDSASCHQVEEEECGLCHTVYMEECSVRQVEELRPTKVRVCRPAGEECAMEPVVREVEEMRPVCSLKPMAGEDRNMVSCSMEKKMTKRRGERKVCARKEEKCYSVVRLEKRMEKKRKCAFHPVTLCRPSQLRECRRVRKEMCNYLDSNQL
jgi:hypothetical protein